MNAEPGAQSTDRRQSGPRMAGSCRVTMAAVRPLGRTASRVGPLGGGQLGALREGHRRGRMLPLALEEGQRATDYLVKATSYQTAALKFTGTLRLKRQERRRYWHRRRYVFAPDQGDAHEKFFPLTTGVPLNTLDHFSINHTPNIGASCFANRINLSHFA